jgi:pSer/pThr/pTyr-binding forkhead associated (FHA) protein
MDEPRQPLDVVGFPTQGSHDRRDNSPPVPCDFVPMRLVLREGALVIELTAADMVLGRHSESDIRLPLPDVSRRHCRFLFTGGHWQVIDLQSLNGVWVNDQIVLRSPLYHGDRLRVGPFVFTVDLASQTGDADDPRSTEPTLHELFRASLTSAKPDEQPRRRAG